MARVVRIQSRICGGGPARHSILLSEGLSYRRGARYDTLLMGGALEPGETSMEAFARARGVSIEIIPEMRRDVRPSRDFRAVVAAARRLAALQPTIVHTHTAKAGAVGRLAARIARVPIVVHTFHGHVFEGYFGPCETGAIVAAERVLARLADRVLALSEAQRRDLAFTYRIAPIEKIQVVPLGLDLDRFLNVPPERARLRQELGFDRRARVVVAAGRFVPVKRFDLLMEAFAEVLREVEDAHLVLAGDGRREERQKLVRAAEAFGNRVRLLGWRNDLERVFAGSDVLVVSSDNEGTPVTAIEALAAGLPVVATRVGGVEDILRPEMGSLVEAGDRTGLARAISRRLRMGGRLAPSLRREVGRRYAHRRLIDDMSALYDDLVQEKLASGRIPHRSPGSVPAC